MRIKSSKKTLSKRRKVAALDADCRNEVVVCRDGNICQRCGKAGGAWDAEIQRSVVMQWAHLHTREYYITRWEPENSLALCERCHTWFDNRKVLSYEWFRKKWPERWQNIQNVLQSGTKTSDAWIRERYEEMRADPPSNPIPLSRDLGEEAF